MEVNYSSEGAANCSVVLAAKTKKGENQTKAGQRRKNRWRRFKRLYIKIRHRRKKKRTRKKRKDKTRLKRGNSHALKCHKHAHLCPPATGEKLEQPALGERSSRQARTVSQRACGARHQACPTHGIPNPAQARKSAKVRALVFLAQVHHAKSWHWHAVGSTK